MKYGFFFIFLMVSCSENMDHVKHDSKLMALLWLQNSIEYEAISYQVYQTAEGYLDVALQQSDWFAYTADDYNETLPPAIIVSIDETVLSSVSYYSGLLKSQLVETERTRQNWMNQVRAKAIKGAVYFLKKAHAKGVTIFYVTKRTRSVIETTRLNLKNLGFPLEPGFETILTPREIDLNGEMRRKLIAKNYRIIMIFGNDLNDFSDEFYETSIERRSEIVHAKRQNFGKYWYILPNPVYGSWDDALFFYDYQVSDQEKQERRLEYLEY